MSPRLTPLCLPVLLLAGCGRPGDPGPRPAARARAALALAAAEDPADAVPDDGSPDDDAPDDDRRPDPDCPRCRGTGLTRTGDGLAEVPCDCLAAAEPDEPVAPEPGPDPGPAADPPRVVVFTAPWCAACGPLKAALASAGGGFELVDVAADPATAAAFGVAAVPTLVRIEGGRETARTVGPRDAAGLRRFRDEGR